MLKINLGAGTRPMVDHINYDVSPQYVHVKKLDIEKDIFPHEDGTVNQIQAVDVLEHLGEGFKHCLNECWRVLEAGGTLYVEVPKFPHPDCAKDPTHVRFFLPETFKYLGEYEDSARMYGFKPWDIVELQELENRILVTLSPKK